jgi:outer membrane protein assembly factor BamB
LLVGGCSHTVENARAYVYLDAVADAWASVAHKPRWQLSLPSAAIDDASFLGGDRVVLGLLQTHAEGMTGYPVRQSVSEIDSGAGTVVWQSIGAPPGGPAILGVTGRRVLVNALCNPAAKCQDPRHHLYMLWDGREVSESRPVRLASARLEAGVGPGAIELTADGKDLAVIGRGEGGLMIEIFDTDHIKKRVWMDVDRTPNLASARMVVGEHQIFVWRSELAAYDIETGAPIWKTAAAGQITPGSQLLRNGGILFAAQRDGRIAILDERTGTVQGRAFGGPVHGPWLVGDKGLYGLSADRRAIVALDRGTGAQLFRISLPGPPTGSFAIGDEVIAVPVKGGIAFYSGIDGHALEVVPLDLGAPEHRLYDQLKVHGPELIVVQETGVAAIDLSTRKPLWSYQVRGLPPPLIAERWPQLRFTLADFGIQGAKDLPSTLALRPAAGSGDPATSIDPIKGNAPDGSFDVGNPRMSATLNSLAGSANLSLGVVEINLMLARIAQEHHAGEANALIANAKLQILYAIDVFSKAIQGDYYVMPIGWLWGAGYFIVDLRNGHWAEVMTTPRQHFQDAFSVDFPWGAISPQGDYLLTCAVSLDRRAWAERTRDPNKPVFPAADEPRHLMRFDIDAGAFAPSSTYPAKSIVNDRMLPTRR